MYRRWDKSKPPQGPFTLNRDCLAAQGLVLWYPMAFGAKACYDLAGTLHAGTGTGAGITGLIPTLGTTGEPALQFANGSSSVIDTRDVVPVSAPPLSVGMWFAKTTAADTTGYALANISRDGGNDRWQFDTHNGSLRWIAVNTAGSSGAASKSGIVSKRWHHALGIEASSSSRFAVLDGVAGTENTTAITVTTPTKYWAIGASASGGAPVNAYFSGAIGEVCVWNRSVYSDRTALADPGRRFELWYPLRSRKWFVQAAAGGQTIAIGQVTETDTAQAVTGLLAATVGQVAEADAAQALTALQALAIAQAAESDAAQAFAAQHAAAIGQVSESDLAQAITALQTAAVGQATETDLAQSVSASQLLVASQATETDLAQAVALQAAGVIGQAEETDLAQPASSAQARVAAQATEADLAQPLTGLHTLLIGLATEADLAQAFSPSQPNTLQQAAEVDLAQAFGGAQLAAVGQVLESDSAQPLSPLLSLVAGMVLEIDVAQPLGGLRLGIAQVSEVDVAQPFVALMVGAHTISPRIYFVPDESRTYLVPDENRLYQVPDSDRSYFI